MCRNSFIKQILLGLSFIFFFASCDKDFNEIGTDIIGDDHFNFDLYTGATIKANNQKLGPISSNNLETNALGIFDNPAFGKTTSNFVTQLELSSTNPTFTTINNAPVIDSVILSIPYFNTLKSTTDGVKTYELDSIYGDNLAKIKLGIYESGYYLRDLDPSEQFGLQQLFYTDKNLDIDNHKIGTNLNNATDVKENEQFNFSPKEINEKTLDENGVAVNTLTPPAMRLHLNTTFFTTKILNAPSGQLYNNNIFKNYLRGLYFKVENTGASAGNMAMINFKKGKITIYYKQDKRTKEDDPLTPLVNEEVIERESKTFILNMSGNTISLLDNTDEKPEYVNAINNPNTTSGDERLYLKGGEGSMAVIDLFGTTDVIGYDRTNKSIVADPDGDGLPGNGVPDELDYIKSYGWLINEANLTFFVDKTKMLTSKDPLRILLYDLTNKRTLIDYAFDNSSNSIFPKKNKTTFGGIVEKETASQGGRTKYKVRITNYVRNLVKNDSTNVRFGLTVTENINNVVMSKLKTANTNSDRAPKMSVLSPEGTILYGTNIPVGNTDYDKKLKLEIYYTKPD